MEQHMDVGKPLFQEKIKKQTKRGVFHSFTLTGRKCVHEVSNRGLVTAVSVFQACSACCWHRGTRGRAECIC